MLSLGEVKVCRWCGRRLGGEHYYRCLVCGETYCWIHMARHQHTLAQSSSSIG